MEEQKISSNLEKKVAEHSLADQFADNKYGGDFKGYEPEDWAGYV